MPDDHADGTDRRDPVSDRPTTRPPETDDRFPVPLRGVRVDAQTRCAHYDTDLDVVALRFPCCGVYYPCFRCHADVCDHRPERVPSDAFDDPTVLCGACGEALSARAYLDCGDSCPNCEASFNPGCRRHRDRYFAVDS